jgi:hypothetical protein
MDPYGLSSPLTGSVGAVVVLGLLLLKEWQLQMVAFDEAIKEYAQSLTSKVSSPASELPWRFASNTGNDVE